MMIVVALFLILSVAVGTLGEPDTTMRKILCNKQSFSGNDAYKNSEGYVMSQLINVTPTTDDYDYYSSSSNPTDNGYGHAACEGHLNSGDCMNCIWYAMGAWINGCFLRIGAQVQMVNCSLRYENYSFEEWTWLDLTGECWVYETFLHMITNVFFVENNVCYVKWCMVWCGSKLKLVISEIIKSVGLQLWVKNIFIYACLKFIYLFIFSKLICMCIVEVS